MQTGGKRIDREPNNLKLIFEGGTFRLCMNFQRFGGCRFCARTTDFDEQSKIALPGPLDLLV